MENIHRKLIDDLEEGVSRLRVIHDEGDLQTKSTGTYQGLVRNSFGRWFLKLSRKKTVGNTDAFILIGTTDIEAVTVLSER